MLTDCYLDNFTITQSTTGLEVQLATNIEYVEEAISRAKRAAREKGILWTRVYDKAQRLVWDSERGVIEQDRRR